MAAYVIADIEVLDPEGYEAYKKLSGPALAAYGGRFAVRGGEVEVLEGEWQPHRTVLLEFDTVEQARAWWNSPEYEEAKVVRRRTARANLILLHG